MGRSRVSLPIDVDRLKSAIGSKCSWSDIATKYGVSKQAVSNWLADGRIPPRALIEIAHDLNLDAETVDEILKPSIEVKQKKKQWRVLITVTEE